jgi:hypothetical protein
MKETFLKTLVSTLATGIAAIILEELKGAIVAKKQKLADAKKPPSIDKKKLN